MRVQGRAMGNCPFPENRVDIWDVQVGMEGLIGDIPCGIVIDLSSLDWYRWMTTMLDLEAHPQSSIPYVHTGFSTDIRNEQLLLNLSCIESSWLLSIQKF